MDLRKLQEKMGYVFDSPGLLERALTHSSSGNETGREDNERLEFLGDSALGLAASEYLFRRYPSMDEGELSAVKAALVSSESLAEAARAVGLGEHVILGRGEELAGGRSRDSVLAGAFEALAAAVYLDGGLERLKDLVAAALSGRAEKLESDENRGRYKGVLQEYAQSEFGEVPEYETCDSAVDGWSRRFRARVSVDGKILGEGRGRKKKEAQMMAAKEAIERLQKTRAQRQGV